MVECRFREDVHAELSLGGTVRLRGDRLLATALAGVVVAVVLRDFDGLWRWYLLDEAGGDPLGVTEWVTAARTAVERDVNGFIGFGWGPEGRVVARVPADSTAIGSEVVFVLVVGRVGRRLG